MKSVLIACITCNRNCYPALTRASLETWDSVQVDGVTSLHYGGNPPSVKHPSVIGFDVDDGLHGMGRKNLLAYAHALDMGQWDYMARINASCYVRKSLLLKAVQELPECGVFRGVGVSSNPTWLWGGAQFIISRDVVEDIVANGHKWNHRDMEDISMTNVVRELGVPLDTSGFSCSVNKKDDGWLCVAYGGKTDSFEFKEMREMGRASDQYFIRVKQDMKRHIDIEIMKELHACGLT